MQICGKNLFIRFYINYLLIPEKCSTFVADFIQRINLTACNLYKIMLKTCAARPKQSLVAFFIY